MFVKHWILMKRELPDQPRYQKVQPQWADPSAPHIFRGIVYVDGSGAMVRWYKEFARAAWTAVVMSDDHGNTVETVRPKTHKCATWQVS